MAVKVNVEGESAATGVDAEVPVPLKATVCGDPLALSATDRVAAKAVADAGVKVTEIEQLAFAASELLQVLV